MMVLAVGVSMTNRPRSPFSISDHMLPSFKNNCMRDAAEAFFEPRETTLARLLLLSRT